MNCISAIVNGKRTVTALCLARFFGSSAQMWMNLPADYDLKVAAWEAGPRIKREVRLSA